MEPLDSCFDSGGDHGIHCWTRPNKVETAVQWFRISRARLAGFSGHGNSIYNSLFKEEEEKKKERKMYMYKLLFI